MIADLRLLGALLLVAGLLLWLALSLPAPGPTGPSAPPTYPYAFRAPTATPTPGDR